MASITVKADFKPVRALMEGFSERRIKTTIAIALTKTAQIAQKEVIKEIGKFDRPTPYALRSTRLVPALPEKMAAYVWLKDRRGAPQADEANYLVPQVFGGGRGRKAYERALLKAGVIRSNEFTVPADGYALDGYGNVRAGVIRQILSQLKAGNTVAGYTSSRTDSAASRRSVKRAGSYFVPGPKSTLPRGIYWRKPGVKQQQMVLKIVTGKPRYQERLPIFAIAERAMDQHFQPEFDKAFDASLARLQQRNATR